MSMERLRVEWSGDILVGPGLTTFYSVPGSSPFPASIVSFFTAIRSLFPTGITWTVPGGGDLIDELDGSLVGTWTKSGGGTVTSNGGNQAYAAGVGGRVSWRTSAVRGGRRVRGTTYLSPFLTTQYEANGSLAAAGVSTVNTAVGNLLTAMGGDLVVWSRPRPDLGGDMVPIDSGEMPDRVSWLRSRRV